MPAILNNALNILKPFNMLLRVYSFGVLVVDIIWVAVIAVFSTIGNFLQYLQPPPLKPIKDEIVMVVGAGKGVGREIALKLSMRGAKVLCVDRNEENNLKTVSFINRKGGRALSYVNDVTVKVSVNSLVEQIKNNGLFVSMLFYCCGMPSARTLMNQPVEDVQETFDVTLTGFIWLIKSFLPEMKANNHGHVVALTSVAGLSQLKESMALTAAQFGVKGLAASLLEDLRVNKITGVHVSLVHVYPFILEETSEFRLIIPGYFGTMTPSTAATTIVDIVLSNTIESSIPSRLLFLGRFLRLLPRKAIVRIRDFLDTGVDFA